MLTPDRPTGWDKPRLTSFLETMWGNTIATFARKQEAHRLCRIDDLMFDISREWKGGSPTAHNIVPMMMFFRSHSAFGSACGLGMGGATVEAMAVLRLSLEFAGYACLIHSNPELVKIWWDRDLDKEKEKEARTKFTHGAVGRAITATSEEIGKVYSSLYERTIQFGGHPNEKAVTGNLKLDFTGDEMQIQQIYLQGDGKLLDHWIRTACQIGICVLKIFEHVHRKRFEEMGVAARIEVFAEGL